MTTDSVVGAGSTVLGRYLLDSEIGSGGMGVVWLATDTVLEQRVALKRVSFAHLSESQAALMRDRTLREARLAARLRGARHVVALYDVQVSAGAVWLVMEYHPSRSLGEVVADRGPLTPREVAEIGADVAAALAHAHEANVQHRDVTPGNVLIGTDGVVKLTDFGIAHQPGERRLTETGVVTGTVSYLAPEVARGYQASRAADVFSLGSTLYHAVEGRPPFGTDGTQMQLLHLVSSGTIQPPQRAGELTPVLLRMLELNPATRPDATTLHAQLCRLIGRPLPVPVHPPPSPFPVPAPATVPPGAPGPGLRSRLSAAQSALSSASSSALSSERTRWVALAAGVLLLVVLGVLGAVSGHGGSIAGTARAAREEPVRTGSILLPRDPRDVDTCRLIQPSALRGFGNVRTVRGAYYEGCSALISSERDEATVEFSMDPAGTGGSAGESVPLGGIRVVRRPAENPAKFCANEIVLSDGAVIYVNGFPTYNDETRTPDLCTMVTAAADAATRILAATGRVPTSPDARGDQPFGRLAACDIARPEALARIPGLDAGRVYPGFANWACSVGSGADGDPQARINLLRVPADDLAGFGDRTIVGGRTAYVREEAGLDNPQECYVRVQYTDPGGDTPADVLGVEVEGARPVPALCASAKALAIDALGRIPS